MGTKGGKFATPVFVIDVAIGGVVGTIAPTCGGICKA